MPLQNSDLGNSLVKSFEKRTFPSLPLKRKLTYEEICLLNKHLSIYSWSNIDRNGNILLGNGNDEDAMYYITEEDLKKLY